MAVDPTRSLMPRWLPRFNLLVTNRVQGVWAPYLPPWAMVVHTGRRSGRTYRTPVMGWRRGNQFAIPLMYGSGAQWVRNLQAAGGGEVVRMGRRQALRNPRVVTERDDLSHIPALASRRMGVLVCDLG